MEYAGSVNGVPGSMSVYLRIDEGCTKAETIVCYGVRSARLAMVSIGTHVKVRVQANQHRATRFVRAIELATTGWTCQEPAARKERDPILPTLLAKVYNASLS